MHAREFPPLRKKGGLSKRKKLPASSGAPGYPIAFFLRGRYSVFRTLRIREVPFEFCSEDFSSLVKPGVLDSQRRRYRQ